MREQYSQTIANKIKEFREKTGYSQVQFAKKIKASSAAISLIEKADRLPSLIFVKKIATAFNISIDELIDEKQIHSKKHIEDFYVQFGTINKLTEKNKNIISLLVKSLLEVKS